MSDPNATPEPHPTSCPARLGGFCWCSLVTNPSHYLSPCPVQALLESEFERERWQDFAEAAYDELVRRRGERAILHTEAHKLRDTLHRVWIIANLRRDIPVWVSVLDELRAVGVTEDP
jgi:hypothetical protein